MKLATFQKNLDLYGSDFENWPEEIRESGKSLINDSEVAKDAFDEMALLEGILQEDNVPEVSPALEKQITAAIERDLAKQDIVHAEKKQTSFWAKIFVMPATAIAAVVVVVILQNVGGGLPNMQGQSLEELEQSIGYLLEEEEILYFAESVMEEVVLEEGIVALEEERELLSYADSLLEEVELDLFLENVQGEEDYNETLESFIEML